MKGPFGKEKLIDPSTAHQIFGRAGRPQFDTEGFVYVLPHEDDVRLLRWKQKYDEIPEDTKDPGLMRKKKELKRKKPPRSETRQYWAESHFERLKTSPPGKLYSKGPMPWRLLAYLLKLSPEVSKLRAFIRKRLLDEPRIIAAGKQLDLMLQILADGGYVTLDPPRPPVPEGTKPPPYEATYAHATPTLDHLLVFRSVHPLYGAFLINQLGIADLDERLQAFESVLELPRPLLKFVRVPWSLPPGPLAQARLDPELIARGLMIAKPDKSDDDDDQFEDRKPWEDRPPVFAEKLALYFGALYPDVSDVQTQAVWGAGEILQNFGGNFNLFIQHRDLTRQEGIVFRHLLRLILLCEEFAQLTPPELEPAAWQAELRGIADRLTETCRVIDPTSTEQMIKQAHAADPIGGENAPPVTLPILAASSEPTGESSFGDGLFD